MSAPREWVAIRIQVTRDRDAAVTTLFEAGVQAVQETADEVITHVASRREANAVVAAVRAACPGISVETDAIPEVDWSEAWKRGIGVQRLGSLVVAPPWLVDPEAEARTVVIEPGMAFGTGDHETTRGVLRLLPPLLTGGERVADLGTGSGVIAIAAAKLGASHVAAIELDPDAIDNAQRNVLRNGVGDRVVVIEGDAGLLLPLVAPVEVITANILSGVLLSLLPVMERALATGGRAVLAGVLQDERDDVTARIRALGWCAESDDIEGEWWSTVIRRC